MKKFLVAARVDRGSISVSHDRIVAFLKDYEFDGYFETSAKQGWRIQELSAAITQGIDWESLPRVSSNQLFQEIKSFLVKEKAKGRLLSTSDDLYSSFLDLHRLEHTKDLRAQFETCIGLVESRDLIRRLNFGNFILLQPEILDSYASAIVNSAKTEPDGLGSIAEDDVHAGKFSLSQTERIKDREEERILIIATIEDMLRHEVAMREQADEGVYLVFPSQLTRANPDLPDPEGKAVVFTFEGPVVNVYATLVVRLSHSGFFAKKELWQNAGTFTAKVGGTCGVFIREKQEGQAELALFFDSSASKETRIQFEDYILAHLKRRALPDSIRKEYVYICEKCATPVTNLQVTRRREWGFTWLSCSVCGQRIALRDREDRFVVVRPSIISKMDKHADEKRERSAAALVLQGKVAKGEFDVFLCHNSEDKTEVTKIGEELKLRGILAWLDEWELRPGLLWQRLLEEQINRIKSAAVFVGENGIGPWQQLELEAFLREFASRNCPVIPVLLAAAPTKPGLPLFLKGMTWVDFRKKDPDPMERLIWGVTGKRSNT